MPVQFRFERTDPMITSVLSAQQIAGVVTWQNAVLDYEFDFHEGHVTAWPLYLREPGSSRDLPKVNLKDWTGDYMQNKLKKTVNWEDFQAVVTPNRALFRILAERYYAGLEAAEAGPGWYVTFTCTLDPKAPVIRVRLPQRGQVLGAAFWANMRPHAQMPPCKRHAKTTCMAASVVRLDARAAQGETKSYNENFQITG